MVVGGGLSAAQLAVHAVHAGWSHVTLLVRSAALEVRPSCARAKQKLAACLEVLGQTQSN